MSIKLTVESCYEGRLGFTLTDESEVERYWSDIILNLDSVYELIKGIGIIAEATTDKHFLTLSDYDLGSDDCLELVGSGEYAELSITARYYGKDRKLSKVVYLPSLLGQVGSAVSDCK